MVNSSLELSLDAILANEDEFLVWLLGEGRSQMMIMEPVLALEALNHELVHTVAEVRLLTVAIGIEKRLIVIVAKVFVVIFVVIKLA